MPFKIKLYRSKIFLSDYTTKKLWNNSYTCSSCVPVHKISDWETIIAYFVAYSIRLKTFVVVIHISFSVMAHLKDYSVGRRFPLLEEVPDPGKIVSWEVPRKLT